MSDTLHSRSERALILAPRGRDARSPPTILRRAVSRPTSCPIWPASSSEIERGAGFALVTEEALGRPT